MSSEMRNPFLRGWADYPEAQIVDSGGRVQAVKTFSVKQCQQALRVPGLQATVEKAIGVRLRKLAREAKRQG